MYDVSHWILTLALEKACWQDETGDVNRFSHSQLVSEQGNARPHEGPP